MMYRDGTYFLVAETFDTVWKVVVYGGPTPLGPFTLLPGNPILGEDCACMFQHPVGNIVYEYYCKRTGSSWTLDLVQADLAAGRQSAAFLDTLRWTRSGGTWSAPSAVQHEEVTGPVADGATANYDILKSSYTGAEYVLEAQGRLLGGRVFGLGVHMPDPDNGYSVNLYEDLDDTDNLYLYEWHAGVGTVIWQGAVGPVDMDAWYKFKVKVGQQGFQLWLDDSLRTPGWVGANPSIASGPAALYLEDGTHAQFDDVRVLKLAPADPAASVGGETTPNTPPVALISAPADGATVWPGQAVTLTSGSTDAQDAPGALANRWDVRMLTDRGDSVVVLTATGANSSFTPAAGDDSTIVRYRIVHHVTDTQGASDSTAVLVWPEADLEPAALVVAPAIPEKHDSLTFSFTLHNLGRAPAPRTRWRLVTDDATTIAEGDQAVPGLDSALVSVRAGSLGRGSHVVRVTADTLDALRETRESNNATTVAFATAPNSKPVAAIASPANHAACSPAHPVGLSSGSLDDNDPPAWLAYRWDVRMHRVRTRASGGPLPAPARAGRAGARNEPVAGDSVVIHTATTANSDFTPPAGDDSTIVYFRIVHRVMDLDGLSDSTSVVLMPEIDLEPAAFTVTPADPADTDSLTFSFTLHNRGRALAPCTRWRLVADDSLLVAEGDTAVPGLDSVLVTVPAGPLAFGQHLVRVAADTLGELYETVEGNNAALLAFTTSATAAVGGPGGIDATSRDAVTLSRPFPNPTRGQGVALELTLPRDARAELSIYDVSGRVVRRLLSADLPAGAHRVAWDGRGEGGSPVPTGLYMVRLQAVGTQRIRRIMVLR